MSIELPELTSSVKTSETLPQHLYTDPAVFELEKDIIFRKQWFPVIRADQLMESGDYLVYDFFGDEIIVLRDRSGEIRAFSNICLHRACPLLEGRGHLQSPVIACPYHKWSYDLEGRLRGAPLMEEVENFEIAGQRLPQVKVELWQGWVFLNIDPYSAPFAQDLIELAGKFEPFDVAGMQQVGTLQFDSPWNWKIMVENFLESYHHMGGHPETLNRAFPAKGTYSESVDGNYILLENPSVDSESIPPFWVGCMLPAALFALIRDEKNPYALWYQMHIDRFDHFKLELHILAGRDIAGNPEAVERIIEATRRIHLEDIPLCEGVWKGVNSRFYRQGRLSHLEECNWQFHDYLINKLRGNHD